MSVAYKSEVRIQIKPPTVGSVAYYVEGFLLAQRAMGHSPNTLKYYKVDLGRFVWFLQEAGYPQAFKRLTPSAVREFFVYLNETHTGRWGSSAPTANRPLSPGGVHAFARAIRAFLIWAAREARCPCPFDDVQMPRLPKKRGVDAYRRDEIVALFSACDATTSPYLRARNRAILAVLLDTGLRASELLALTTSSVTADGRAFLICGQGDNERWVTMGAYARGELQRYVLLHRESRAVGDTEALFLGDEGRPLHYGGLREMFVDLKVRSGITRIPVKIHTCRHTAASVMHRNGMRLSTLQDVLGHSNIETTKAFYLDISPEDIEGEHSQYGPLDNMKGALTPGKAPQPGTKLPKKALPAPAVVLYLVQETSYRGVGRRFGYSDTYIRQYLKKAGLI